MKKCIFVGPSVPGSHFEDGIDYYGPVALGSVFRAVENGYHIIGIVDGVFGAVPSVWHKEILYALAQDCIVVGAASLGALRAAEMHIYGMKGAGLIYHLYRRAILEDDDELSLLHTAGDLGWESLTVPMINIRMTLRAMLKKKALSPESAKNILRQAKATYFASRDEIKLKEIFDSEGVPYRLFEEHYVDQKKIDGLRLIHHVKDMNERQIGQKTAFFETVYWKNQFVEQIDDIPRLVLRKN